MSGPPSRKSGGRRSDGRGQSEARDLTPSHVLPSEDAPERTLQPSRRDQPGETETVPQQTPSATAQGPVQGTSIQQGHRRVPSATAPGAVEGGLGQHGHHRVSSLRSSRELPQSSQQGESFCRSARYLPAHQ